MSKHLGRAALLVALLALGASEADAQGFGDRLKKRAQEAAKKKVEERTEKRAGEAADKAIDAAECAATDKLCRDKAAQAAQQGGAGAESTEATPAASRGGSGGSSAAATGTKPGEGVWANYDFTPGNRILFSTDFADDEVGDFPRRLELKTGNVEVVEWQGRRFLRATSEFEIRIPLKETLPERFTLEMDVRSTYVAASQSTVTIDFANGKGADVVKCGHRETGIYGVAEGKAKATIDLQRRQLMGKAFRCRVMADGKYTKVYADEQRVSNHPNTTLGRTRAIVLTGFVVEPEEIMIGNIVVTAGGKKLYDALTTSGRVATQGIFFDTGSDRIRPESTPTLKEIAQMLADHPELKLTIEGHTDDVGDGAANQALSEKRAAAVKAYLTSKAGVDAARLASKGLGASKPAVPNTSAEARQQNRRVELVKM